MRKGCAARLGADRSVCIGASIPGIAVSATQSARSEALSKATLESLEVDGTLTHRESAADVKNELGFTTDPSAEVDDLAMDATVSSVYCGAPFPADGEDPTVGVGDMVNCTATGTQASGCYRHLGEGPTSQELRGRTQASSESLRSIHEQFERPLGRSLEAAVPLPCLVPWNSRVGPRLHHPKRALELLEHRGPARVKAHNRLGRRHRRKARYRRQGDRCVHQAGPTPSSTMPWPGHRRQTWRSPRRRPRDRSLGDKCLDWGCDAGRARVRVH